MVPGTVGAGLGASPVPATARVQREADSEVRPCIWTSNMTNATLYAGFGGATAGGRSRQDESLFFLQRRKEEVSDDPLVSFLDVVSDGRSRKRAVAGGAEVKITGCPKLTGLRFHKFL